MSIVFDDVLKIDMVLVGIRLLSTSEERDAFDKAVDTEVLESAMPSLKLDIGAGGVQPNASNQFNLASTTLLLSRDRITLELTPDRSNITREYPNREDLDRLANVIDHAIGSSKFQSKQLRAYGFNIDATYTLPSEQTASQFIANRLFASNPFQGYHLKGGMARFHLIRNDQTWNIRVEPRLGDPAASKVFVSLNLHIEEMSLPSKPFIKKSLNDMWDQVHSVMDGFNTGA